MKKDSLVDWARKIYASHKEELDYIYKNKSDRLSEVTEWAEDEVKKAGYVLGSPNKGYARFLTKDLVNVIPRTGLGWKNGEAFAFELVFWPKQMKFATSVAPGDENNRKILSDALKKLKGSIAPRGELWLVHYEIVQEMDVTSEEYSEEHVRKAFGKILQDQKEVIKKIERFLLKAFAENVDHLSGKDSDEQAILYATQVVIWGALNKSGVGAFFLKGKYSDDLVNRLKKCNSNNPDVRRLIESFAALVNVAREARRKQWDDKTSAL